MKIVRDRHDRTTAKKNTSNDRRRIIVFVVFVFSAASLVWYGTRQPLVQRQIWREVKAGGPVRLENTTPFEWDSVVILGPYTSQVQAEELIGTPWPGFDASGISTSDSINVLVFLKDDSIVETVKLPRNHGDFVPNAVGRRFSVPDAVFSVVMEKDWRWLQPIEASSLTF